MKEISCRPVQASLRLEGFQERPANGLSFPVCLLDRKDHWMTSSACLLQPLDRHLVKEDVKEEEDQAKDNYL